MSNAKDGEDRSDKTCCCGGHNANNAKKNLNHHSTFKKYIYRKGKQAKEKMKDLFLLGE